MSQIYIVLFMIKIYNFLFATHQIELADKKKTIFF